MIQIQENINDATTGHKLQGMSKDVIVVLSWCEFKVVGSDKLWESLAADCKAFNLARKGRQ